ncbi:MAG: DNA gyrase subunit A, partial [Chloroflexi bacterium]|nr:DNA gyrase subunit A [Chloroflexota bacterium]
MTEEINTPDMPETPWIDNPDAGLITVGIDDQMRTAYLDYAMSVIVSRALPDVRDGL